jgi:hypothetical protein
VRYVTAQQTPLRTLRALLITNHARLHIMEPILLALSTGILFLLLGQVWSFVEFLLTAHR